MSTLGYQHGKSTILTSSPLEDAQIIRTINSGTVGPSGQGTPCDFSANIEPSLGPITSAPQLQYLMDALYISDWQAKKIIDLPVDDMLREPFSYGGLSDEEVKSFNHYLEAINFYDTLHNALRMERLYGGSVIFMGFKDEVDDPSQPVDFNNISFGDLLFLNAVPRTRIQKGTLQINPLLPDYGKPMHYMLDGKSVHKDRLLIFDGSPMGHTYSGNAGYYATNGVVNLFQLRDGFGIPILLPIYNDLMWATGSRQAAYHLINKASVTVYTGDIQSANVFKDTQSNITALSDILNSESNYRAVLLNSVPGCEAHVENLSANFGAIPELILRFSEQLAAASGIPTTIFLSQSPKGMDSSGDSDAENHYTRIAAEQQNKITPVLKNKFLKVALPSAGIRTELKDVDILYKALWDLDEEAKARVRQLDTSNIIQAKDVGLISDEQAMEEFKQREVFVTDSSDFPAPEPVEDGEGGGDTITDDDVKTSIESITS